MIDVEFLEKVKNLDNGLEGWIGDGNEKHNYRVVCIDSDSEKTVSVMFTDCYIRARQLRDSFVYGVDSKWPN